MGDRTTAVAAARGSGGRSGAGGVLPARCGGAKVHAGCSRGPLSWSRAPCIATSSWSRSTCPARCPKQPRMPLCGSVSFVPRTSRRMRGSARSRLKPGRVWAASSEVICASRPGSRKRSCRLAGSPASVAGSTRSAARSSWLRTRRYSYDTYTAERCRGRGIAGVRALWAADYLREAGYRRLVGWIAPQNRPAFGPARKAGYRRLGVAGFIRLGPWRRDFVQPAGGRRRWAVRSEPIRIERDFAALSGSVPARVPEL